MGVRRWLPGAFRRLLRLEAQAEEDVRAELGFHLAERAEELEAEGLPATEARRRAEREFGDLAQIEAETRRVARGTVRRLRWRDRAGRLAGDVRFALRTLARNPLFTVMAVGTLALGIGATTAVFTVVDAALFRPLPLPDPDRLVVVWERTPSGGLDATSPANFQDFLAATVSIAPLAGWEDLSPTMTDLERPRVASASGVSAGFFAAVGVPALRGRVLTPGDQPAMGDQPGVAVISHRLWRSRFDGRPDAIGRTIELEGVVVEVVGVMPPEFAIPREEIDLWLPSGVERREESRYSRYIQMLGRLRPGVTLEAAESELNTVAARLAQEYPATNEGYGVEVVRARDQVVGEAARPLLVVLAAVSLLLLLATVNVSGILLGRATARGHEYAVRSALGASRGRLRTQLLVESLTLGAAAAALGVGLAWLGVEALLRLEPEAIPRASEVALDLRVLGFALLVALGAGTLAGVVPGSRAARTGPAPALRGRGQGRGRRGDAARRALVVAELALSIVLLITGGLLLRTFVALRSVDLGYATENVLVGRVELEGSRYRTLAERRAYFAALTDRVRAVPGVAAAGITSTIPLSRAGIDFDLPYRREGDPPRPESELPSADYRIISPGTVEALGMRLLRGRDLAPADRAGARPVVLINRSLADRLWAGENPIGRRVIVDYVADEGVAWEVVGLVEDTRHRGIAAAAEPQFFVPAAQAETLFGYMTLVARTRGPATALADAIRDAVLDVDPVEPLYDIETMAALRAGAMARERLAAALVGIFALIAFALAAAGVYGVVSYQVARRTHEIGVRMALGAARGRVLRLVVGDAAVTATIGLAIGLLAAAGATQLVEGLLFGVSALDLATYSVVAALLLCAALLAAWMPARRAAGVDPVRALRTE